MLDLVYQHRFGLGYRYMHRLAFCVGQATARHEGAFVDLIPVVTCNYVYTRAVRERVARPLRGLGVEELELFRARELVACVREREKKQNKKTTRKTGKNTVRNTPK